MPLGDGRVVFAFDNPKEAACLGGICGREAFVLGVGHHRWEIVRISELCPVGSLPNLMSACRRWLT